MSLKSLICAFSVSFLMLFFSGKANGIILHPENDLIAQEDRPSDNVTGKWNNNASCVVIGPNLILTTAHQQIDIETAKTKKVNIAGISYSVDKIVQHGTADLRLVQLKHANFTEYVSVYSGSDELSKTAVIGGYGDGIASELFSGSVKYGYLWDNSDNTTLRWGTNQIDYYYDYREQADTLMTEFGRPYKPSIKDTTTRYECSIADHDSGCGWFIYDENAGEWLVMGLSIGVNHQEGIPSHPGQTWYLNRDDTSSLAPDYNFGLRLSKYASWIETEMGYLTPVCDQYIDTDFDGNCVVDVGDLAHFASMWLDPVCDETNNFCEHADLFRDGIVNLEDFAIFAMDWMLISN